MSLALCKFELPYTYIKEILHFEDIFQFYDKLKNFHSLILQTDEGFIEDHNKKSYEFLKHMLSILNKTIVILENF